MFPMGAMRRLEDSAGSGEASPRPANESRFTELVWVHEGPVCVDVIDEPARGFHDNTCRCGGCQALRVADPAELFLP